MILAFKQNDPLQSSNNYFIGQKNVFIFFCGGAWKGSIVKVLNSLKVKSKMQTSIKSLLP